MAKPPKKNGMTDALQSLVPVHDVLTGKTKIVPQAQARPKGNALKPFVPQSSTDLRTQYANAMNSGDRAKGAKLRAQIDAQEAAARKRR